jgi:hypothetical protein
MRWRSVCRGDGPAILPTYRVGCSGLAFEAPRTSDVQKFFVCKEKLHHSFVALNRIATANIAIHTVLSGQAGLEIMF